MNTIVSFQSMFLVRKFFTLPFFPFRNGFILQVTTSKKSKIQKKKHKLLSYSKNWTWNMCTWNKVWLWTNDPLANETTKCVRKRNNKQKWKRIKVKAHYLSKLKQQAKYFNHNIIAYAWKGPRINGIKFNGGFKKKYSLSYFVGCFFF